MRMNSFARDRFSAATVQIPAISFSFSGHKASCLTDIRKVESFIPMLYYFFFFWLLLVAGIEPHILLLYYRTASIQIRRLSSAYQDHSFGDARRSTILEGSSFADSRFGALLSYCPLFGIKCRRTEARTGYRGKIISEFWLSISCISDFLFYNHFV